MALGPRKIEAQYFELSKGQFSVAPATTLVPTTSPLAIDFNSSGCQVIDLSSLAVDLTLTFTNAPRAGAANNIRFIQHATVPKKITWPATVKWRTNKAPALNPAAASSTLVNLFGDGTNVWGDCPDEYYSLNADVDIASSPEVVDTFPDTWCNGVMYDVMIRDTAGANVKMSLISAAWNPTTDVINYSETTLAVVGTISCTLALDITTNAVRLMATATTDNWLVQAIRRPFTALV